MSVAAVIAQQFLNALMLGTIYSLIAIGFSLYFGTVNIIQFAHGDVFMVGAFVALTLVGLNLHSPVLGAAGIFLVGALITGVIGLLFGRISVRPLLNAPPLNTLLSTMALGLAVREAIRLFYPGGSAAQRFRPIFPTGAFVAEQVVIRYDYFFILGIGLAVLALTGLLVNRTRIGMAIRAISQDREIATVMGVNLSLTLDFTFFIASVLAAVAGGLHGAYYGDVIFTIGLTGGLVGFSAAIIGGLGDIWGAVLGGYLFSYLQTFAAAFIPGGSAWREAFAFVIVIGFLIFRPSGILGEKQAERV